MFAAIPRRLMIRSIDLRPYKSLIMPHKGPNTAIDANTDAISNYLWMEVALNAHAELTDTNAKSESSIPSANHALPAVTNSLYWKIPVPTNCNASSIATTIINNNGVY